MRAVVAGAVVMRLVVKREVVFSEGDGGGGGVDEVCGDERGGASVVP